jgi:iron complex transport system substrate-binding protein
VNLKILTGILLAVILLLLFLFFFIACSPAEDTKTASDTSKKIISLGASNTEIITALGFGENITGTDTFSRGIDGLSDGVLFYDLMELEVEQLIAASPDIVFTSEGLLTDTAESFLEMLAHTGLRLVKIPPSTSLDDIMRDINDIAEILGAEERGGEMVAYMTDAIEQIRGIAAEITSHKTVYFELDVPPFMFSFGRGTFLHEMLELIGAQNIFNVESGWIMVSDEQVLSSNPDVILTSAVWFDDPIADIVSRPNWSRLSSVRNRTVFVIDPDASNRQSHNVITALRQMAEAVYPEYYSGIF